MADDSSDANVRPVSISQPAREALRFRRVVVIGGGCYGSWYTQQLTRATLRGALVTDEIVVVDRNHDCLVGERLAQGQYSGAPVRLEVATWADYLADWMSLGEHALADDAMVPSPLMPHLCLDWLLSRAQAFWPEKHVGVEPLVVSPSMPWERAAPDGRHYVSFATWMCPVNCIEPATCPATKGPRDWSMPPALRHYAHEQRETLDDALIFHCVHRTYGVGMIDAAQIARAANVIQSRAGASPLRLLVGTVSHCHGALGMLVIS